VKPGLAAALAAIVTVGACASPSPPADPEGELVSFDQEPLTLDPQKAFYIPDVGKVELLFSSLLTFDRDGKKLIPDAAAALPEISADGLTYRLTLRAGLRDSRGHPIVAGDFVYSFQRLCDPATANDLVFPLYAIRGCERYRSEPSTATPDDLARDRAALGVSASDDRTIRFDLREPAPYFSMALTLWYAVPVSAAAVATGDRWTEAATIVGNGSFTLSEWRHRERMVFVRNEFHEPKAKLKRIVLRIGIGTPAAALAAYRAGEVDTLGVAADIKEAVLADPVLTRQIVRPPATCTTFYAFNVRKPPVDDPLVRLALAKSFDRATYARDMLSGLAEPTRSFVPPGVPGSDPDDDAQAYDPAAARELLARSSYAGRLPPIELAFSPSKQGSAIAQWLQGRWRTELGADVRPSPIDATTFFQFDKQPATAPQLISRGLCVGFPDPEFFLSTGFASRSPGGRTGYKSEAFDRLVAEADRTTDPSRRAALYRDAQRILTKDAPAIFVASGGSWMLVQPWVHGYSLTALDHVFGRLGLSELFVEKKPQKN